MRKSQVNALLRSYVREHLSPSEIERKFVSEVYASIQNVLGERNCIQIGSLPRYTAITPLHDLDVLYLLGEWGGSADPTAALTDLESLLSKEYENPTAMDLHISRQTHSITLSFRRNGEEEFAVDIVPAYTSGQNEFGDAMCMVPEVLRKSHAARGEFMRELAEHHQAMSWISSDPRGYISVATELNRVNSDFRKATKFVKAWKGACKAADSDFPLKSFHIEQILTRFFQNHQSADIFDAIFHFFTGLPGFVTYAAIPDRADPTRLIDAYVDDLTADQRRKINQARDHFLIHLEEFEAGDDVADLLKPGRHQRSSDSEAYLFDSNIPMLCESEFSIVGHVQPGTGGFRAKILDAIGFIENDRKIDFSLGGDAPEADLYKWKVKNDDNSPQPRGEITDHHTLRQPEHTKYRGKHYVECFAIQNGVCIARSKQNVVLGVRD